MSVEKEIVRIFARGGIHGQDRQSVHTGKATGHGHWRPRQGRQSVHIGKTAGHGY